MFKEKDIMHENGKYWVLNDKGAYYVMISGFTHAKVDSAYASLSLAIARCNYMASREV